MTSATTSHVTTGEPPECCLFKPNRSNSRFGYEFDRVPRYLLRLYAPECCGESNETKVASRAAISKKDPTLGQRDIFSIPPREAADLLNQHLRWDRRKDPRDNLMSWTSSLLFALQLGFYRHVTQNPPPAFSDIKLCIIDTTGYPSGTFLQDVVLIRSFMHAYHPCGDRDLNSLFKIRTDDYYFGEYLSQGTLNIEGRSCHVSLEQLIQYGLFNILPELGVEQHWEHWAHSVKRLRVVLLQSPKRAQTSKTEIRKMITIGQGCFGNGFALPMTCMLLALRKRSREDETILGGLLACFSDDEINNFSPGDMKVFGENLPEVEQFSEVVRDLHKRFVYFRPLQAPTDSETTRVSNRDAANSPGDSFEGVAERFSNMHV